MNFALACLTILVLGAFWTAVFAAWWNGPTLPEQVARDVETRAREALR